MADTTNPTSITGLGFVIVYVDDFDAAFEFYSEVLGLEKTFEPDSDSCFFAIGAIQYGLLLRGGLKSAKASPKSARASFVLMVESARKMYQKLRLNGVEMLHDEPMDMGEGDYWFQFRDPAGNVLEVLGG